LAPQYRFVGKQDQVSALQVSVQGPPSPQLMVAPEQAWAPEQSTLHA
jgi:hypothetical protein